MESPNQSVNRYSDADLAEFKAVIEKKLATAYEELEYLKAQINDTTESMENDGDYMDDSNSFSDMELFHNMAHRTQKHVQALENALFRISNKSYGVCTVTGELIDKRRLLVVPTTTMSVNAKNAGASISDKKEVKQSSFASNDVVPKIVSKPVAAKTAKKATFDDDLDFFGDEDEGVTPDIDFDAEGVVEDFE
jgi:RNA polymerase-binding transcription factor DksA